MCSLKITLNGEALETDAATLADLCAALGYAEMKVATALNGDFVPAGQRAGKRIHRDDRIEIVAPRQGG
jgi:sulfur carrier protein